MSKLVRVLLLVLTMVAVMMPAALALAEGLPDPISGLGLAFFNWETIGTFSGAVALTVFLVQVLKLPLDRVWKIPTQYVVYMVSLGVLLLAQQFVPDLGGMNWEKAVLCVFNAALVALSAMSTYTVTIQEVEAEKLMDTIDAQAFELGCEEGKKRTREDEAEPETPESVTT